MKTEINILKGWLAGIVLMSWTCSGYAAPLDLASTPLFLGSNVDGNVFFELDDSGSMDWETLTFDYYYYETYWENTNEPIVLSGVWENVTDETTVTTTTGGGRGRGRGRRGGGGGTGGGTTTTTTTGGDRKDFWYLYDNNDRLYQSSTSVTTAEDQDQAYERDWRGRLVDFNLMYYNPENTYQPWDSTLPDANFSAARSNPQPGSDGYNDTRNLNGFVFEVWFDDHGFVGDDPDGPDDATDGENGIVDLWDSHIQYTIEDSSIDANDKLSWVHYTVPNAATMNGLNQDCDLSDAQDTVPYQDCFGTQATSGSYGVADINPWGRSFEQEKQNIANWYQYYRKRSYVAKGAIARVIAQSNQFRYGLSLINDYNDIFIRVPAGDDSTYAAHNASLIQDLFDYEWEPQGTPLRRGLERVGKYFNGDYSGTDPIISECQQNFSILLTDGFWNGSAPAYSIGDADGDGYSRTVADVAKYYYDRDLSSFPNSVPTSIIDPNNAQHMVTFTVAFGLRGALQDTDGDGFPNPVLDEDDNWGNVYTSNAGEQNDARIDDLWHAAINSKGWYIQAQDPDDVVDALNDALSDITDRVGSSASVATNSGSLNAGSHLFQARFDSGGWSGQLIAFAIQSDATLNPVPSWEASEELDMLNYDTGREIMTYNPTLGKGVPFRFPANYKFPSILSGLSTDQVEALLTYAPFPASTTVPSQVAANQVYGENFVNYLRGQRNNEGTGAGRFRTRNSALGDIVDSDPKYVGVPRFRYPDTIEAKSYLAFRNKYADRDPMVYVGSNDGMVHGFRESDGVELIAYIPNKVFDKLPDLGQSSYLHEFFVNEAPIIVDAYFPLAPDSSDGTFGRWKTVLAGGLGAGGQGVYALDVTNPAGVLTEPGGFDESDADDLVLWEFDDSDDADLGYTYGEVQIAKMQNGRWAAVFSNGYNNTEADGNASSTGNAYLFIVDIESGNLIKKIDTGAGLPSTPNGLSTPSLIDVDGDSVVDTIYAGDFEGNVWKFDVSSSAVGDWDVAFKSSGVPVPLFTTINSQPITSPIQVTTHPEGKDGYMLYFGTGKYLELADNGTFAQPTQAFYGIWDRDEATLTAFDYTNLLQQYITDQRTVQFDTDGDNVNDKFNVVRDSTDIDINYEDNDDGTLGVHMGWFILLQPQKVDGVINTSNFGEKQVSKSVVRDGRVIFTTVLPSAGACDFGGSSFTMTLDYTNGGLFDFPAFDLNGDGTFDDADPLVSGQQSEVGIVPTVSILSDDDRDIAFGSGSSGDVEVIQLNVGDGSLGRQSWRELR